MYFNAFILFNKKVCSKNSNLSTKNTFTLYMLFIFIKNFKTLSVTKEIIVSYSKIFKV